MDGRGYERGRNKQSKRDSHPKLKEKGKSSPMPIYNPPSDLPKKQFKTTREAKGYESKKCNEEHIVRGYKAKSSHEVKKVASFFSNRAVRILIVAVVVALGFFLVVRFIFPVVASEFVFTHTSQIAKSILTPLPSTFLTAASLLSIYKMVQKRNEEGIDVLLKIAISIIFIVSFSAVLVIAVEVDNAIVEYIEQRAAAICADNSVDSQTYEEIIDLTPIPDQLIVNIANPFFILDHQGIDLRDINNGIVTFLNITSHNYRHINVPREGYEGDSSAEKLESLRTYRITVNRASIIERERNINFAIHDLRGNTNLNESEAERQSNWMRETRISTAYRVKALRELPTFENAIVLAEEYRSKSDSYYRLGNIDAAYDNIIKAIEFTIYAFQLSLSLPHSRRTTGIRNAISLLTQLYGRHYLQRNSFRPHISREGVLLHHIEDTERLFRDMHFFVQYLDIIE